MSVNDLVNAFLIFVSAVIWPCTILLILWKFAAPLRELIGNLNEFSLKGGGFDISGKRAEVTAAITAAVVKRQNEEGESPSERTTINDVRVATSAVQRSVTRKSTERAEGARILWVDNKPNNNVFERQSLEALGVRFIIALSTDAALEEIKKEQFSVIISDLNRPEGSRTGYDLLEKLRRMQYITPLIFYSSYRSTKFQSEAINNGAFGFTNRPEELLRLVLAALNRHS